MSPAVPKKPMKDCAVCGNAMPASAVYCTECENFQDGRWRVRFAKELLPMLVALVAVIGAVLPPILAAFDKPDAILVVSEVHSTRISVTNLGDAPGIVNAIRVDWGIDDMPLVAGTGGGTLVNSLQDPVVRPGETRWFDLALPEFAGQYFDFTRLTDPFDMPCRITVATTTAQQDQQHQQFLQRTCGVLLSILPDIRGAEQVVQ